VKKKATKPEQTKAKPSRQVARIRELNKGNEAPPNTARTNHGVSIEVKDGRLREVEKALALCMRQTEIEHHFAEKWSISTATVRGYIGDVRRVWRAQAQSVDRANVRDQIRGLIEESIAMAQRKDDHYGLMRGADTLARLFGANEPVVLKSEVDLKVKTLEDAFDKADPSLLAQIDAAKAT
jgi:hypothetical protein